MVRRAGEQLGKGSEAARVGVRFCANKNSLKNVFLLKIQSIQIRGKGTYTGLLETLAVASLPGRRPTLPWSRQPPWGGGAPTAQRSSPRSWENSCTCFSSFLQCCHVKTFHFPETPARVFRKRAGSRAWVAGFLEVPGRLAGRSRDRRAPARVGGGVS